MFVRPVLSMDQTSWVAAHVAAWEFLGGCPRRLVSDNLKTGVIKADLYDPKLNHAYAEMAAHHGCLIDPARAPEAEGQGVGFTLHLQGCLRGEFRLAGGSWAAGRSA